MTNKVSQFWKLVKKIFRKVRLRFFNSIYASYTYLNIDNGKMLITSNRGSSLGGNMLRLLIEAYKSNEVSSIGVAAKKSSKEKIRKTLDFYGLKDVKLVGYDSLNYYKWLGETKYLFCDSTLPNRFIKKEGQIYVNTWHGTPQSKMGIDSKYGRFQISNVQKNFLAADMLVFPSDYCRDILMSAYNLTDIYQGEMACVGSPRNSIFFDDESREAVRKQYDLNDKKVYIYMPADRKSGGEEQRILQTMQLENLLEQINSELKDEEVLYVRLRTIYQENIDFEKYEKVRIFPQDIEIYEFLNICDAFISDYSDVMYDFANTGKMIVRYVYDEEGYEGSIDAYEHPIEMPFPKVYNVSDIMSVIRAGKKYDDKEFLNTFCQYENRDAAKLVLEKALTFNKREDASKSDISYYYNERLKPGIISDNLGKIIEENQKQIPYQAFSRRGIRSRGVKYDDVLEKGKGILGLNNIYYKTVSETIAYILLHRLGVYNTWIERKMEGLFTRECKRLFAGYPISEYIFYQGNSIATAELLSYANGKRTIYVYYYWLNTGKPEVMKRLLARYDSIVACDEEMVERVCKIVGDDVEMDKISVNEYYLN